MTYLLVAIAGLFAGAAVLLPEVWFGALFGVALLAYSLSRLADARWFIHFLHGCLFGVIYTATALFWLWDVYPLTWAGIPSPVAFALVYVYWTTASIALGILYGILSLGFRYVFAQPTWLKIIFAASLWTIIQYIQMCVASVLLWGPGSVLAAHISAVQLGNAFAAFSPLLILARYGGVYGLTFAAALLGFALWSILEGYVTTVKGRSIAVLLLLFGCIALTLLDTRSHIMPSSMVGQSVLNIGAVTTDYFPKLTVSDSEISARKSQLADLLLDASTTVAQLDLLVLPAGELFTGSDTDRTVLYRNVFGATAPIVFDTVSVSEAGVTLKTMRAYSSSGKHMATIGKTLLTPVAEYPLWLFGPVHAQILKEVPQHIVNSLPTVTSENRSKLIVIQDKKIGVLMCAEIFSSNMYRQLSAEGARILVHVCPDNWLHHGELSSAVILSMAKIRAVESGRYLMLVPNGASSAVLSDAGEIIAKTPVGGISFMTTASPLLDTKMLYTLIGEWILMLPFFVVVGILAWVKRTRVIK